MTVLFKAWAFVIHRNMEVAFQSFNHILIFEVKKSVIFKVEKSSARFSVFVCMCVHVHTDTHVHLSVFI